MSRNLTIGSDTFVFPDQGTKAGWGEVVTDFCEAVSDQIGDIVSENDLPLTTVTLTNNQSSATNVGSGSSLLLFSTTAVRSFEVTYNVYRDGTSDVSESGKMYGSYNESAWVFSVEKTGDAGITFTITSGGQVQYTSSALTGHVSSTMVYKAQTLPQ